MSTKHAITHFICLLLSITSCFTICSCKEDKDEPVKMLKVFDQSTPFIAEKKDSSVISLPHGVTEKYVICNSKDDLCKNIPQELEAYYSTAYNVDFEKHSIIVCIFRIYYPLIKVDTQIMVSGENNYDFVRNLMVKDTTEEKAFNVFYYVVTEKIQSDSQIKGLQSIV